MKQSHYEAPKYTLLVARKETMVTRTCSTKMFCRLVAVNIFTKLLRRHLRWSPSLVNLEGYKLLLYWRATPIWKLFLWFLWNFSEQLLRRRSVSISLKVNHCTANSKFSRRQVFWLNLKIRHLLLILRKLCQIISKLCLTKKISWRTVNSVLKWVGWVSLIDFF